ncbi:MAG: choloylglycine hydrolase [Sphingomonas sp.]|nr:choloylglycine hydrolase [Sphingomonas sp.]
MDTSGSEAEDAWPTLWFTLADSTDKTYIFQSAAAPNAYWIELSELNFAPGSGQRTVDAYDASLAGDVTRRLNQSASR